MKKKIKINEIKEFGIKEVLSLIIITCIVCLSMGYLIGNKGTKKYDDKTLNELIDNYNKIIDEYEGNIDKKKLLTGAVDGMLNSLDEHSTIIDDEYSDTFYKSLNGSYEGIGIEITNDDDNNIVIVGVLDNSPAKKAGLQKLDIVKSIDGTNMTNTNKSKLTSYVKENDKDNYKMIIERDGTELEFTLKKEMVAIKSVASKYIERDNKKIGYIYISIFSNTTAEQFKTALDELELKEIDSLIIDVRENSGGHLTTTVKMLSYLLNSDKVIYKTEKNGETKSYYSKGTKDYEKPIVLIQNANSASASELFVASLKEQLNAYVVGEVSYGKGTIQEVNYLSNGDTYKFTTKKWKTPNGKWIDGVGIKPDLEVKLIEEDNQLEAAINHIVEEN